MAGYPMTYLKVFLENAEYNELESAPLAYTIAASMALKEACQNAKVVLLEPFMLLEVTTPSDHAGEVISDINSRRGKILSMGPKQNKELVKAIVPLSEMFGYSTQLRSKTQGRGTFVMVFEKYEKVPMKQAKELLEKRGIYI